MTMRWCWLWYTSMSNLASNRSRLINLFSKFFSYCLFAMTIDRESNPPKSFIHEATTFLSHCRWWTWPAPGRRQLSADHGFVEVKSTQELASATLYTTLKTEDRLLSPALSYELVATLPSKHLSWLCTYASFQPENSESLPTASWHSRRLISSQ